MGTNKKDLIYPVIWNGNEVLMPESEYQKKLHNFSIKFNEITGLLISKFSTYSKKSEVKGIKKFYLNFKNDNNEYPFYIGYIKNSGEASNHNKRLQIYGDAPNFNKNSKYYGIGIMPTGDDEIVTIVEMSQFVENKIKSISSNFSSLWISFEKIKEAYIEKKLVIEEEPDKIRYIFRKSDKHSLLKVLDNLFPQNSSVGLLSEIPLAPKPTTFTLDKLPRNNILRNKALERANFTCELCGKKNTFLGKDSNWYFEAHHLIPFNINNQKMFEYSLDHLSNLVCLCPECHRKVHFADLNSQIECLEYLLNIRHDVYKIYSIKDVQNLINYYKGEE